MLQIIIAVAVEGRKANVGGMCSRGGTEEENLFE